MDNSYKDILYKMFEDLQLTEDKKGKTQLRIQIWNTLMSLENLDSEDYYIWGLTYYDFENDVEQNTKIALGKFLLAIEIDPNNYMARLYLAHCYQDMKKIEKALEQYEKVDKSKLKDFQIWRYVKLLEQIGYCQYKLGRYQIGEAYFKDVVEWYKKLPENDRALPTEMLNCLPENHDYLIELRKLEDYLE